jgi:hypothetical protein
LALEAKVFMLLEGRMDAKMQKCIYFVEQRLRRGPKCKSAVVSREFYLFGDVREK